MRGEEGTIRIDHFMMMREDCDEEGKTIRDFFQRPRQAVVLLFKPRTPRLLTNTAVAGLGAGAGAGAEEEEAPASMVTKIGGGPLLRGVARKPSLRANASAPCPSRQCSTQQPSTAMETKRAEDLGRAAGGASLNATTISRISLRLISSVSLLLSPPPPPLPPPMPVA